MKQRRAGKAREVRDCAFKGVGGGTAQEGFRKQRPEGGKGMSQGRTGWVKIIPGNGRASAKVLSV